LPSLPPFPVTDDHPVVNVSWRDAFDYCEWAGGQLPSEEQWEYAARGADGRLFPWGSQFDASRCHSSIGSGKKAGTAPVGSYPTGATVFGCLDMAGNVNQWTSSPWDKTNKYCVIRGGSWRIDTAEAVGSCNRPFCVVSFRGEDVGFRVSGPVIGP
jgi:formylglycine-generating enzyme required for sulfatase activity